MKIIDVLKSEECEPLFKEVQEFVRISLSEYNDTIERDGFCYSDKDIFDFVWGTVDFSAAEICILDSPLLQRLRRIRQLGLASTVYCNADSSRFSHTIGVAEVASRMAQVINKKMPNNSSIYNMQEIVRLAAIFHDTGHMFFSHVSELFFSRDVSFPRYSEVTQAVTAFCSATSSTSSLHEIFSVMIVNSPETLRLFKLLAPHLHNSRLTNQSHYEQLAEYISSLIIGIPVDKTILPYSSIINSAIDADKLDYLSRDSACTKVPIAVDIARIIQKLDVVSIKEIDFPQIWNGSTSDAEPLKIMAIKSSAKKVFWQLSNARSSMYESVYYHHKVLTAETMFRNALQKLYALKESSEISFTEILQLSDDAFSEHWSQILLSPDKRSLEETTEIEKLMKCIRERNLYKRVAAFSRDSLIGSVSVVKSFFRNVIENPLTQDHKRFCDLLQDEYRKVCSLLMPSQTVSEPPIFMFIHSKHQPMSSMPFESGDGFCIWSSRLMKQETIEAGKKSKQDHFYLTTNCKERKLVYLALEKTLTKFGIYKLSKESAICSKVPYEDMSTTRMRLLELDYYKDALYLLPDDNFERLYDKKLFADVVKKFQSFHGVNSCQITNERLLKFLRQFLWLQISKDELTLLLDGILRLLKATYYLDRDSFNSQVSKLIEKFDILKSNQKYIITLGGLFDSSKHLMYYFNDVKDKGNLLFDGKIENALMQIKEDDCLCFFDDGAYSGKQVISIFQELMGVPVEERTTNEHHVDELSEECKQKLINAKISLCYLCFNSISTEYIRSELQKIGLKDIDILFVNDLSSKVFDGTNTIFTSVKQSEIVKIHLAAIGSSVLSSTKKQANGEYKPRWDQDRIESSALGYNDAQQMVVFASNVPTYTITAFWANGHYVENEWMGLFQRTDKD